MKVKFGDDGLIPAVVIHAATGEVLTLAWMNAESLERTRSTGETWFWSRSRQMLWHKGETSGNTQAVVSIAKDCDDDALVVRVLPSGPACHLGTRSCWVTGGGGALTQLDDILRHRRTSMPEGSYSARLFADTNLRIKKIGEESAEFIHAALTGDDRQVAMEAADLLFHVAAVLHGRGLTMADALAVIEERARA